MSTPPIPSSTTGAVTWLRHNKVDLALHHLRDAVDPAARPLLLLHGLGEATPAHAPDWTDAWPGAVVGLDLTGHGRSSTAPGGGYTAEVLMADAATAATHLAASDVGGVTVVGRGLGAYVALLVAGACPGPVQGAVLADGPGLAGGGPTPGSPMVVEGMRMPSGPPDPFALIELSHDVRPPDYAVSWALQAAAGSDLDVPITVAALVRPPWLAAVAEAPGVAVAPDLPSALATYA